MFNIKHIMSKSFCSSKMVVGLSIKIYSMVNISAALKPELGMILDAFILASNTHTHEQPQLNNQDYSLQMR